MKLRKWEDVARENFTPTELEEIAKGAQASSEQFKVFEPGIGNGARTPARMS